MFIWALSHPPPRMEWTDSIQNKWELLYCQYGIAAIKWVKQLKIDCHARFKWSKFELSDARWEQGVLGESYCTSEKCWTSKLWKVLGCLSRASLQADELLQPLISEVVGGCHTSNLETTSEFLSESDPWSFGDWDRHEESPLHCRVLWSPRDVKFLRGSRHWLADYLTPSCQSGKNCQKLPVVPVIMVITVSPQLLFFQPGSAWAGISALENILGTNYSNHHGEKWTEGTQRTLQGTGYLRCPRIEPMEPVENLAFEKTLEITVGSLPWRDKREDH